MKRIIYISISVIIFAVSALIYFPLSERRACFQNAAFPDSITQATAKIGNLLHHTGKEEWLKMGFSEQELRNEIKLVEVTGPTMTFEHPSTRYITFSLSNCPSISEPITVSVYCDDTPNLGWVAKNCSNKED